ACPFAAERALHLIQRIAGGKVAKGNLSHYPKPYTPKVIVFDPARAVKLLGVNIPARKSYEILSGLGFTVKKEQDYIVVKVPSWRKYDVTREVDLIEEVVRIYGMRNVVSTYPLMHSEVERDYSYFKVEEVKEFLSSRGLCEAINYSFIGKSLYEKFGLSVNNMIKIANPLSEEWVYMRDAVFPSLVQNGVKNINRNERDVFLFEVARVFKNTGGKLPQELLRLGLLLTGKIREGLYNFREVDFFDLKGVVESLLEFLSLEGRFEASFDYPFMHPGQTAKVSVNGQFVGFLGRLHPDVEEAFDVQQPMFVAELYLDKLLELSSGVERRFSPIPKFPPVMRDLAFIVDKDFPVARLEEEIRKSKFVEKVVLFDVYEGKGVPKGKKSIAFSITFRAPDRTLSDEEVNGIVSDIIERLSKLGAKLRA
ncbi:MAG: phenylalanine--tRNA ligase subunit beta, partial [Desulfurobacteriaceae bacterium]